MQQQSVCVPHLNHSDTNSRLESIVLVAGLGGHYLRTWQAPDRTLWPIDLLPQHVGDVRVLSFHYNTTVRGTTDARKIDDHAGELLDKLDLERLSGHDVRLNCRPIIYVGHSLGGMLIKRVCPPENCESSTTFRFT